MPDLFPLSEARRPTLSFNYCLNYLLPFPLSLYPSAGKDLVTLPAQGHTYHTPSICYNSSFLSSKIEEREKEAEKRRQRERERERESQAMSFTEIPILDLALAEDPETKPRFLADLRHALMEVGFMYVKNVGIPDELFERVVAQGRAFFDIPMEEK